MARSPVRLLVPGLLPMWAGAQQDPPPARVSLADERHDTIADATGEAPGTPADWFRRVDLWGNLTTSYLHTESGGAFPEGGLAVEQGQIFLAAEARENVTVFFEVQTDYWQRNTSWNTQVGEAYVHLRHLLALPGDGDLALKVGRFDNAFGEYYLQEDGTENALIGFPVILPYGFDEGVQAHAAWQHWNATVAFTDGSYSRQSQEGMAKALTARLRYQPDNEFTASASVYWQGEASASALCINNTVLQPVGQGGASTLGSSPSPTVSNIAGELDLIWQFADAFTFQGMAGGVHIDDAAAAFDRDVYWYTAELRWRAAESWTATLRWSEGGTFDDDEGFQLSGRPYGNAIPTFGHDLSRFSRLQVGVRWQAAPQVALKAEVGFDDLTAIDISATPDDHRAFVGTSLVVTF